MGKTALIGVGNILFCDEGIGVYASRYMQENYRFDPPIEIIDGGTLGFGLSEYLSAYDTVLLLDTTGTDAEPGTLYALDADALLGLGDPRKSVHEIEVIQMLEMARLEGSAAQVRIVGIVPEDILSMRIALSDRMEERFGALIGAVLSELQKLGVGVQPVDEPLSLKQVIAAYNAPMV